MLPKTGRKLPLWTGVLSGREIYARTIAELLHSEHGDSRSAIKQIMRQTGASERTVKHWLAGQHGPDTVYFLRLVVSSPIIRAFALGLIEVPASTPMTDRIDRVTLAKTREAYVAGEVAGRGPATNAHHNVPEHVPKGDPINDPYQTDLNERQRRFLDRVVEGRCSAREIAIAWTVSFKTARRDIAALKAADIICYIGSPRKGRYIKV